MMLPNFTWIDFLLCMTLLASGIYGVYFFRKRYKIKSPYFVPLFYAKLLGLAVFLFVSITYSNLGDTFKYYEGSKLLFRVFLRSPWVYFKVVFSDNMYVHELLLNLYPNNAFKGDFSFLSMVKIVSFFNTICFNSFWATSLLFSYFSFIGSWMMYVGLKKICNLNPIQSIVILFFPSVLFWASGIMKDSLCYSLLGVLFYFIVDFHLPKSLLSKWLLIIILLLAMYLIFLIKWYILFAFLGAYFLMLAILLIRMNINTWQIILFVCFSVLIIGLIVYEIKYDFLLTNRVILRIKDFHNWHFLMSNSKYSFEEMEYNVMTMIKYFPEAVFTALFRPFLWEINNYFLFLSAIESLFFLILAVKMVVKFRWRVARNVLFNPYILWVIFFFLLLSYITGLSSYSFGALSRYRIPVIPFYLVFMFKILESFQQRVKSI